MEPEGVFSKSKYKKKLVIALFIIAGVAILSNLGNDNNTVSLQPNTQVASTTASQKTYTQTDSIQKIWMSNQETSNLDSGFSNSNYYTNSVGNQIHSPAYSN
jgi:hypothetical protein